MPRRYVWLVLGGLVLTASACSGVTHRPVSETADASLNGIRYYEKSLFLMIHSDGHGGLVTRWDWLPDCTKKMTADPHNFVSDLTFKMTYDEKTGTPSEFTDKADSSVVPRKIVAAAGKLMPAVLKLAALDEVRAEAAREGHGEDHHVPAPYIFKVVVRNGAVQFIGDGRTESIRVTIVPELAPAGS